MSCCPRLLHHLLQHCMAGCRKILALVTFLLWAVILRLWEHSRCFALHPVFLALLRLSASSSPGCSLWPSCPASAVMPPASQSAVDHICVCVCVWVMKSEAGCQWRWGAFSQTANRFPAWVWITAGCVLLVSPYWVELCKKNTHTKKSRDVALMNKCPRFGLRTQQILLEIISGFIERYKYPNRCP